MAGIHRGPGMRTSRTQAIDIGTSPQGFPESPPYCPECGKPIGFGGVPHSHYDAKAVALPESTGGAKFDKKPF